MEILATPQVIAPPTRTTRSGDGTTMWDSLIEYMSTGTHPDPETGEEVPNRGTWFNVAKNVTRNQQATLTSTAKKLGWHCTTRLEGELTPEQVAELRGADGEGEAAEVTEPKDVKSKRYAIMSATIDKTRAEYEAERKLVKEAKAAENAANASNEQDNADLTADAAGDGAETVSENGTGAPDAATEAKAKRGAAKANA